MRHVLTFALFCCIACSPTDDCQDNIKELGICDKHDAAKWEIYKLYIGCLHQIDTLQNIFLANDINFENSDTLLDHNVIISFDSEIMREIAENNKCFYYNGIGFENDQIKTFSRGDYAILEYDKSDERLDSIMKLEISKNQNVLTPWIYKQSKIRGWLK